MEKNEKAKELPSIAYVGMIIWLLAGFALGFYLGNKTGYAQGLNDFCNLVFKEALNESAKAVKLCVFRA